MAESVEWVWQHYIFVEKCLECKCNFWNNRYSSSSSEETLTKLKEHSFNKHNITKYSEHNVEYDENNKKMVPVRGFIRKHFLKLKENWAECIHCFDKINYTTRYYYKLYYHLKDNHKDKLTEIQKKETLFPWYWDHFTIKGECAICNSCNVKYGIREVAQIIKHLKSYKKPGPSSSSHTNNTNSNTDMGTHAKETNKCQENAHSPPMVEREAGDESVLQHYDPILICKKCDYTRSLNNEASLSLSKDILTKLEKHLLDEHNTNYDFVQDDINKKKIPVRRYIRKHFSTLKEDMAKCNICFEVINYQLEAYMLRKHVKYSNLRLKEHLKYNLLHEHLKHSHEDKLTEIQKNEQKLSWHWDYFTTIKNNFQYAICTICIQKKKHVRSLKVHLKNAHKKTGPSSSSDTDNTDNDTDMGQPTKEAEREENTNSPQNGTAIMAEQKTEDNKWVFQYYNPTLTCHKCNVCFSSDNDNILSSKETLTKLKDHLLHEHKLDNDSIVHNIQHNVNKEEIPVCHTDVIRKYYTKLRGDAARCNYCFVVISYTNMNYSFIYRHLICKHKDKLTEVEKNYTNFWLWNYFTIDDTLYAKCHKCFDKTSYCAPITALLTDHLKTEHKITSPSSSRDTDTNIATDMGTSTKEAKRQGDSKALSNNMYKMTLATSAGTSEETSSHNEPSSSSSYGYDMDFSAQHQSRESFGAPIPLSNQIRELDTVNENVPSTSESTVSFDQPDFDLPFLQTLFSFEEELYLT